jgi:hypothetical protein
MTGRTRRTGAAASPTNATPTTRPLPAERRPDVALLRTPVHVERGGAAGLGTGQQLPPRLRVVRAADLVDVTFGFEGLMVERRGKRLVLLRSPRARRARLVLVLPPQSVAEAAYPEDAPTGDVQDEDLRNRTSTKPSPHHESPPAAGTPVPTLIGGPSQLVFDVGDHELDFTLAGLLGAIRWLPLVVGRNAPAPKGLPLLDANAAQLTLDRAQLRRATARLGAPRPAAVPLQDQALAQLRSNAIALEHRFGREAAATWVAGQLGVLVDPSLVEQALLGKVPSRPPRPADPFPAGVTGVELPFRLLLSPHADAAFALRAAPPEAGAVAELWHARLGLRRDDPAAPVDEQSSPRRTVRAVWATDRDVRALDDPGPDPDILPSALEPGGEPHGLRLSLNSNDRLSIVHQTSDFSLKRNRRPWTPPPIPVDRLFLSTLGGWLDAGVSWPTRPGRFELEEWRHLATLGRDHYVRVVRAGFLFPTGHRASFVKVTERRFHTDRQGNPAFLRQRYFIVVREAHRVLPSLGDVKQDRRNPFHDLRLTTVVTPPLDPPVQLHQIESGTVFQPTLNSQPFLFQAIATDAAGNLVEMAMPALFVGDSAHGNTDTVKALVARYDGEGDPKTFPARTDGQRLAFAPPERPGDTELSVSQVRLAARNRTGAGPKFGPILASATADIPAVEQLTGRRGSVEVSWPKAYLTNGFAGAGNGGQVFLQLAKPARLDFSANSARSGALVAPDISIQGLSRVIGPVGVDPAAFAGGNLDPAALFSSALEGAKLFGVIGLADIIDSAANDVGKALRQAPTFLTEALTKAAGFQRDVQEVVAVLSTAGLPPEVAAAKDSAALVVDQLRKALTSPDSVEASTLSDAIAALVASRSSLETALAGAEHGLRRRVLGPLDRIVALGSAAADLATDLLDWARGLQSPTSIRTRVVWHPLVKDWTVLRFDRPDRALTLAIDMTPVPGTEQSVDLSCSVEGVTVDLEVVALKIDLIRFAVRNGQKPDIEVKLAEPDGVVFGGPLAFVEGLRSLIPLDGFSDPPSVDISPTGLQAGFSLALPNLAVGIFSLENLSLSATLDVPFIGESLSFRFAFCTRERPFQLIVSLFGGGGFLGIELTPKGIRSIEASLEFGAAVSMDFAVASGSLSVMAGIYFRYEDPGRILVSGYFRARGEVDVLGLISASIELTISLTWQDPNKVAGRATLTVEVEVLFFSASVSISCEKRFSGSGQDPTFLEVMGPADGVDPWAEYCRAFVGV